MSHTSAINIGNIHIIASKIIFVRYFVSVLSAYCDTVDKKMILNFHGTESRYRFEVQGSFLSTSYMGDMQRTETERAC